MVLSHSLNNITNVKSIAIENKNGKDVVAITFGKKMSALDQLMSFDAPNEDRTFLLWPLEKMNNSTQKELSAEEIERNVNRYKFKITQILQAVLPKEAISAVLIKAIETTFGVSITDPKFSEVYKANITKQTKLDLYYITLAKLAGEALSKVDLSLSPVRLKLVSKNNYLNLPNNDMFIEPATVPLAESALHFTKKEIEDANPPAVPQNDEEVAEQTKKTSALFS